ncbi:SDR family oxidoreductase [Viridibacillus sp. YIM B01967]|uniref:SDR family oxidoreductase n=1 Tax=Viridibacillus soli TaxID=2798301 RepID=A0ABS1H9Y3_9BACL|nr:SDR family oxidoreductase [Viridibacillus soli]MBK3495927.1 SDR family oxidoreductase [Viridibacillus soli]
MKITIFGATGRVGHEILQRALADGHEVTALVRSLGKLKPHTNLQIIKGDVKNYGDVTLAIAQADSVISAIGTDKTTTLSEGIPNIIKAMLQLNVKRIVTIGTAGILDSRAEKGKLRFQSTESKRKLTFAAEEHAKVFYALKETELDWTIACPTYLPDGGATGVYRTEKNRLPLNGEKITVGDTAHFVYEESLQNKYNQSRVGLAY